MNEPHHAEIHEDDGQAATKGDVRKSQQELAGMMANSFNNVATKDDLAAMEQRLEEKFTTKDDLKPLATKDDFKRVLEIVKTIDVNTRGIPAKVERLTKAVFPHR